MPTGRSAWPTPSISISKSHLRIENSPSVFGIKLLLDAFKAISNVLENIVNAMIRQGFGSRRKSAVSVFSSEKDAIALIVGQVAEGL